MDIVFLCNCAYNVDVRWRRQRLLLAKKPAVAFSPNSIVSKAVMGKLHKIRKAVEANPEAFLPSHAPYYSETAWKYVNGAHVVDGNIKRTYLPSYKKFIYKVLCELGYKQRLEPSKPTPVSVKFKVAA